MSDYVLADGRDSNIPKKSDFPQPIVWTQVPIDSEWVRAI